MATNATYNLNRFSDAPSTPKVRVVRRDPNERTAEDRQFLVRLIFLSIALAVLCVYTVMSNMELTRIKAQITARSEELTELQSENIYMDYQIESLVSLQNAEAYARDELGLVKMGAAQIEYVNLEQENMIVTEEPPEYDRSALAFLSTILEMFSP